MIQSQSSFHFYIYFRRPPIPGAQRNGAPGAATFIRFSIRPGVVAISTHFISHEVSFEEATVCKSKPSFAFFLSFYVFSFVLGAIWPRLNTLSVLMVLYKLTLIEGTVSVVISSFTMGFVGYPHTIIDVTIGMDDFTFSICFVIAPGAFVY